MSTPAIVALRVANGWAGTFVTYDGYPANIVPKLAELCLERRGRMTAVWRVVSSTQHGWTGFLDKQRTGPFPGIERPGPRPRQNALRSGR